MRFVRSPWLRVAAVILAVLPLYYQRAGDSTRNGPAMVTEAVNDHLRILSSEHPVAVGSGGIHQVKPWFQGKTSFSPPVPDLTDHGFVLIGGQMEVIHRHPVAAIVYKRRQHIISLYVSRAEGEAAEPALTDLSGYHLVHWTGDLEYWAVSDVAPADLRDFADLIRGK